MAVVLDTSLLPPTQRAAAVRAALSSYLRPAAVSVAEPALGRLSHWELGSGAHLLHSVSSGHRVTCTAKHLTADCPPRMSLSLPVSGSVRLRQRDLPHGGRPGELLLVDLTSPYDVLVEKASVVQDVIVDYGRLALPVEAVRSARPRLTVSPMYELVRRHLRELPSVLDRLGPASSPALLGSATVELIRALIASVATHDGPWLRDAMAGTLFTRVTAYIRHHQRDPDLGAAQLAAAHGVSVRTIYAAFAREGRQLSEWVIQGRLQGAHQELAQSPAASVSSVARSWGFSDTRHFARRFRAEYGLSPTEWQRLHRGPAARHRPGMVADATGE